MLVSVIAIGAASLCACDSESNENSKTQESETAVSAEESDMQEITSVRIGTYNIANGREIDHDMQIIANDIVEQGLDIVGLQEVDRNSSRSNNLDTIKVLSELTGYQYYVYIKCLDMETINLDGEYGTAILSKYPIIDSGEIELNDGTRGVERRMLGYAKIDINGTVINFYNTHLTIKDSAIRKYMEFPKVVETLKNTENCFLTGDFNVESYSEWDSLDAFLDLVNTAERDIITTTPDEGSRRIDNIMYSDDFTLIPESIGVRINDHSDHYMLYADFELPKK